MQSFLQFLAEALGGDPLAKITKLLVPTQKMENTGFLLPDGTRLSLGSYNMHSRAAEAAGTTVPAVLHAGAVRYQPYYGIEVGSKITDKQARIVSDDWIFYGGNRPTLSLSVDIVDEKGGYVKSKEFEDVSSPSAIRNWTNAQVRA